MADLLRAALGLDLGSLAVFRRRDLPLGRRIVIGSPDPRLAGGGSRAALDAPGQEPESKTKEPTGASRSEASTEGDDDSAISGAGLPLKKPKGDADNRRRAKYQLIGQ